MKNPSHLLAEAIEVDSDTPTTQRFDDTDEGKKHPIPCKVCVCVLSFLLLGLLQLMPLEPILTLTKHNHSCLCVCVIFLGRLGVFREVV